MGRYSAVQKMCNNGDLVQTLKTSFHLSTGQLFAYKNNFLQRRFLYLRPARVHLFE